MKLIRIFLLLCLICLPWPALATEAAPAAAPDATIIFTAVVAALLAVSEALALIPVVRANSVFQLLWGLLKKLAGK